MFIKGVSFLLIAICIVTSVNAQFPQFPLPNPPNPGSSGATPGGIPGYAQLPQYPVPNPPNPGSSGAPPGGVPPYADIIKCWSTLMGNFPGCIAEIELSKLTGTFGNIGPACCKACVEGEASCMPPNIQYNPFFPPMLKQQCAKFAGPPKKP